MATATKNVARGVPTGDGWKEASSSGGDDDDG